MLGYTKWEYMPTSLWQIPTCPVTYTLIFTGIISRLDYLEYLGVDAIWLGPIFESSRLDKWMDVTNFTAVDGAFGILQDFEELVAAVHNKSKIYVF